MSAPQSTKKIKRGDIMKTSEIKQNLKEMHFRIAPDALQEILRAQENFTKALIISATKCARAAGRKTVFAEDVNNTEAKVEGVELIEK